MQRRTFLQSVAAAMASTVTGRLPAADVPLSIDYSRFTDYEPVRYDLDTPWSHEGVTYATDSRILISHAGEFSGDGGGRFPDVGKLWWDEFDIRGWKPFPMRQRRLDFTGQSPYPFACPECRGRGRVGRDVAECQKCAGCYDEYFGDDAKQDGEWYDMHGNSHPSLTLCPDCTRGATGGILCGYCSGSGESWIAAERIGGVLVDGWYADSIRTLPEPEYRIFEGLNAGDNVRLMAFRFGAGDGRGFAIGLREDET